MNIGLVCNVFALAGGMERYAITLVDALAAAGHRATVFAREFDADQLAGRPVTPVRLGTGWVPRRWRDAWFSRRVRRARRHAGLDGMIGCARIEDAEIAICGGLHIGYLRQMGKDSPSGRDRRIIALERRYYNGARAVVAHAKGLARELVEDYGLAPERVHVIYPPTAGGLFRPPSEERRRSLRAEFGFPDDRVVFAFPSFSHKRKGFAALERLFTAADLPVLLAVTGRPVPKGLRNIRYLGARDDMEAVYQAADYSILASRYEPFGLVGTESVLCGTPAVLPNHIGAAEVLGPEGRIGFDVDDEASLADAVAAAARRAAAGRGRIADPRAAIGFDPDPAAHIRALLALLEPAAGPGPER